MSSIQSIYSESNSEHRERCCLWLDWNLNSDIHSCLLIIVILIELIYKTLNILCMINNIYVYDSSTVFFTLVLVMF
jgi:hypothetical protein